MHHNAKRPIASRELQVNPFLPPHATLVPPPQSEIASEGQGHKTRCSGRPTVSERAPQRCTRADRTPGILPCSIKHNDFTVRYTLEHNQRVHPSQCRIGHKNRPVSRVAQFILREGSVHLVILHTSPCSCRVRGWTSQPRRAGTRRVESFDRPETGTALQVLISAAQLQRGEK